MCIICVYLCEHRRPVYIWPYVSYARCVVVATLLMTDTVCECLCFFTAHTKRRPAKYGYSTKCTRTAGRPPPPGTRVYSPVKGDIERIATGYMRYRS